MYSWGVVSFVSSVVHCSSLLIVVWCSSFVGDNSADQNSLFSLPLLLICRNSFDKSPSTLHSQRYMCLSWPVCPQTLKHPHKWGQEIFLYFSATWWKRYSILRCCVVCLYSVVHCFLSLIVVLFFRGRQFSSPELYVLSSASFGLPQCFWQKPLHPSLPTLHVPISWLGAFSMPQLAAHQEHSDLPATVWPSITIERLCDRISKR